MKKLTLLFILFFALFTFLFGQQYGWMVINPVSISGTPDFSDVFFTNVNTGWITSSSQANIYKTVDGAATFSTQTTSLGSTNAIHMLDGNNGYSGGQGGWVYKTSDGGLNWNILASMGSLTDISFPFNADTNNPIGYACGDAGRVWEITSTLTDLNCPSASDFGGISAPFVNNVWVCGGNRIYYYNGTDFTSQTAPTATFNDIHFINNQQGWVVGNGGVIGHTTDGGNSWNTQTNPDPQNRALYGVFFLDSDKGWAVGNGGIILQTSDGGTTWTIEGAGLTTKFLRGVHFTSSSNGYIVGNDKTLLKYTQVSGIEEEALAIEFELFPNPVHENLYIKCSDLKTDNGTIQILSIDGKEILKTEIRQGNESIEIDLDKLEAGMYLCKISIGNRGSTKKIIKE